MAQQQKLMVLAAAAWRNRRRHRHARASGNKTAAPSRGSASIEGELWRRRGEASASAKRRIMAEEYHGGANKYAGGSMKIAAAQRHRGA
jgi:hypothetical protein